MNARDILVGWVRTDLQRILGDIADQTSDFGSEIHVSDDVAFFVDIDGGDIDRAGNSEFVLTLRLAESEAPGPPQACLDLGSGGLEDAARTLKASGSSLLAALSESARGRSNLWLLVAITLELAAKKAAQ